jgi:hypothetical protein
MPQNALLASYEAVEMGCGGAFSLPATGPQADGGFVANFKAIYAPDSVNLAVSVEIEVGANNNDGWYAVYDGPNAPFGGYQQSGTGLPGDLSCYARFLDVKLYSRFSAADIYFVWSAIEIRINGSLAVTLGGGTAYSAGMGPLYVFPHSGLALISGGASLSLHESAITGGGTPPYSGSYSATAGGTIFGGYRYKKDGVWFDLPTASPTAIAEPPTSGPGFGPPGHEPTITAPYGLDLGSLVVSTSTWGNQIHAKVTKSVDLSDDGVGNYVQDRYGEYWGGNLYIVPNTPRALHRINPDFLASVFHWGAPYTLASSARQMAKGGVPGSGAASTGWSGSLHTPIAAGAEELTNAAGVVDTITGLTAFCGISGSHTKEESHGGSSSAYQLSETVHYDAPNFGSDSSVEPNKPPYQTHATSLGTYYGSAIVHPFWSFGYVPGDWNLYGGAQRWATDPEDPTNVGYWGYVREQYLAAAQKRNHVVSCPLEVPGWQQFLDAFNLAGGLTSGYRWLGVSRWLTQEVTPPASVTTDEDGSDAWDAIDGTCTLAFGSGGVTLTGSAGSVLKVRIDVGRFDCHPYLYPLICDRLTVGWETAGVDSVKVFAATSYGDRAEFAGLVNGTPKRIPVGQDSKYAGSWGYDDGAGIATDGGADTKPAGVSPGLSYDPENSLMYRLLSARSPGLIEIEVTLEDDATEAVLHWPIWHRAEGERHLEAESGQVQSLVWEDGPGIRLGNQFWYDGESLVNPPIVVGLGAKWCLLDWLCFKRLVLMAEPFTGGTPDLTTELTQIFDTYEVQSVDAAAFGTLAFVLPSAGPEWRVACVHAVGEIPPLAAYPRGGRDGDWGENDAPNAGVWAWAQGPRRIVTAGTVPSHLHRPDATQVTTEIAAPSGWKITEHSAVVNNSEAPDWTIRRGEEVWAEVTPWHGWLWAGGLVVGTPGMPRWIAQSRRGQLHIAAIKDGDVWYSRAKFTSTEAGYHENGQVTSFGDVTEARMVVDEARNAQIVMAVTRESGSSRDLWLLMSTSDGADFDSGTLFMADAFGGTPWEERGGALGLSWFEYDSGTSGPGTQKAKYKPNAPGASFSSTYAFKDSTGTPIAVSDGGWCNVAQAKDSQHRLVWCPILEGESTQSVWYSTDNGETWTRVV